MSNREEYEIEIGTLLRRTRKVLYGPEKEEIVQEERTIYLPGGLAYLWSGSTLKSVDFRSSTGAVITVKLEELEAVLKHLQQMG